MRPRLSFVALWVVVGEECRVEQSGESVVGLLKFIVIRQVPQVCLLPPP